MGRLSAWNTRTGAAPKGVLGNDSRVCSECESYASCTLTPNGFWEIACLAHSPRPPQPPPRRPPSPFSSSSPSSPGAWWWAWPRRRRCRCRVSSAGVGGHECHTHAHLGDHGPRNPLGCTASHACATHSELSRTPGYPAPTPPTPALHTRLPCPCPRPLARTTLHTRLPCPCPTPPPRTALHTRLPCRRPTPLARTTLPTRLPCPWLHGSRTNHATHFHDAGGIRGDPSARRGFGGHRFLAGVTERGGRVRG